MWLNFPHTQDFLVQDIVMVTGKLYHLMLPTNLWGLSLFYSWRGLEKLTILSNIKEVGSQCQSKERFKPEYLNLHSPFCFYITLHSVSMCFVFVFTKHSLHNIILVSGVQSTNLIFYPSHILCLLTSPPVTQSSPLQ